MLQALFSQSAARSYERLSFSDLLQYWWDDASLAIDHSLTGSPGRRVMHITSPTWQMECVISSSGEQKGINPHSSQHTEPEDGMVTIMVLQYYERSAIEATLNID